MKVLKMKILFLLIYLLNSVFSYEKEEDKNYFQLYPSEDKDMPYLFHIYDLNYTTEIDIFYQYELFKNDIHNNSKSYNVHEHRKVPFENEIKNGKRRIYQNFEEKNNYFKKINANRRSETYENH